MFEVAYFYYFYFLRKNMVISVELKQAPAFLLLFSGRSSSNYSSAVQK